MKLMLDSGAFSFYNSYKNKIDPQKFNKYLYSYIDFINKCGYKFDIIVSLDVMFDPDRSFELFKLLRKECMEVNKIIPVIQRKMGQTDEDVKKQIDKYIELGSNYIGIGSIGRLIDYKKLYGYLDLVFNHIEKLPMKIKTHGFACTSFDIMYNYPFTSVDSISYILHSGYGTISTFDPLTKQFRRFFISKKNKKLMYFNKHLLSVNDYIKKECYNNLISSNPIWKYLDMEGNDMEMNMDILASDSFIRVMYNFFIFKMIEEFIRNSTKQRQDFTIYFGGFSSLIGKIKKMLLQGNMYEILKNSNFLETFFNVKSCLKLLSILESIKEEVYEFRSSEEKN